MAQTDSLRVLVADDQADVLHALRLLLKSAGHQAEAVDSPTALLRSAAQKPFDVILMDMNYARDTTSGTEGLDVIRSLRGQRNETPIIVMTAWSSVDLAVEAMRIGASDFVQKPWDNQRLLHSIEEQAAKGRTSALARHEIEIARNVQRKLLPAATLTTKTLDCAGECRPAREVGGDYFDFIQLGPDRVGIVLADVSGKGVGAALLMANLQALFRTHTDIVEINRLFKESTPSEQFATVFYGVWDGSSRRFEYANCGHPPATLRRASGAIEWLEPTTTVLGVFNEWRPGTQSVQLASGDSVLVCSDGICETEGVSADHIAFTLGAGDPGKVVTAALAMADDADDATAVAVAVR